MPLGPSEDTPASIAQLIVSGFEDYRDAFATITQRATQRFAQRDWPGMRRDTLERLDLYAKVAGETAGLILRSAGAAENLESPWETIKSEYLKRIADRCETELACTFFNSVSRKIFDNVGFDPRLAFAHSPATKDISSQMTSLVFTLSADSLCKDTLEDLLTSYDFRTPFMDMARDATLCMQKILSSQEAMPHRVDPVKIEMIKWPFFRGMSAYLVGRLMQGEHQIPLVLAINNAEKGLYVDAVLTGSEQLRIVFSFSRAYFHVRCDCPSALVRFLKLLMPGKRVAELYIGLGFHKHDKTELYRDLLEHQKVCGLDRFDFSPGKRGMVMVAFNMPQDDLIYKVIRDRFDSPKQTTAKQVMEKYDYVFKHDRAGRLVDVQTFENLELEACCFTPDLLSEIESQTRMAATMAGENVIFHHAYVERRVTPLDIYLQNATPEEATAAVIDYGQAIKDLAQVNVFPGDLLIKNFGVTNLGRVVFYDYDELCPLTDCNFRKLPQARQYDDELNAEPWFMVADNDVFPEEFAPFLGFSSELLALFKKYHEDLLHPQFWQTVQRQVRAGIWKHIRPYDASSRLRSQETDGAMS